MARPSRDILVPDRRYKLGEKLELIAKAFKDRLERVQKVATKWTGDAKQYASEATEGMPKKHIIATTFALCDEDLAKMFGRMRWRCSMSESEDNATKTVTKRVKTILAAVHSQAAKAYDEWPPIEEFMHDFSASSHSIPELTSKDKNYVWKKNERFKVHFAAESEMKKGGAEFRAYAITRDMVKLCLVECEVKAVLYRGYEDTEANAQKRQTIIDAIADTIKRCPSPGRQTGGWLLVGLVGKWPDNTTPYFHTYEVGASAAVARDW